MKLRRVASGVQGLMARLDDFGRDERGSVLVTFTVMIAILLGFAALATDAGTAYWNRRMLQDGADAAALAGAASLPLSPVAAVSTAKAVATENGIAATELGAVSNNPQVTSIYNTDDSVVVSAQRADTNGLRYVEGGGNLTIGTGATAIISALSPTGLWPLAIQTGTDCSSGCTLKQGAGNSWTGNFGWIALGATGASQVRTNIENGYSTNIPTPVSTPTSGPTWSWNVSTQTGNSPSSVKDGFTLLFNWDQSKLCDGGAESCAALYAAEPDSSWGATTSDNTICATDVRCPRVGIVPVISQSWSSVSGNSTVTIIGFECFYVSGFDNGASSGHISLTARSLGYCFAGGGSGGSPLYNVPLGSTGSIGAFLWR